MKTTDSLFLQKKRINRRVFLAAALGILTGCHSAVPERLPLPFYGEKKKENDSSLLRIDGPIVKIQISSDSKFMMVAYQRSETLKERENQAEKNVFFANSLDLFNMEFQIPYLITSFGEEAGVFPSHFAFADHNRSLLLLERQKWETLSPSSSLESPLSLQKISLPNLKREDSPLQEISEGSNGCLSPQGVWFAVQEPDKKWKIIDLTQPQKEIIFPNEIKIEDEIEETTSIQVDQILAFSSDGGLIATQIKLLPQTNHPEKNESLLGEERIAIWDLSVARQIPLEKAKKLPLEALLISHFSVRDSVGEGTAAFSPNGQMIALRNHQNYVGIWQTGNGRLLSEFGEHHQKVTALRFSPNNTKLAVGTGGDQSRVILWDIRKGNVLRTYDDPERNAKLVTALEFSPDGKILYFGNERGSVKGWEYQNRKGLDPKRKG